MKKVMEMMEVSRESNEGLHSIRGKGSCMRVEATKGKVRVGAAYSNSISSMRTLIFHLARPCVTLRGINCASPTYNLFES